MKVVRKCVLLQRTKAVEHAYTELQVLRLLQDDPSFAQLKYAFQDELFLYLVMDFIQGGELFFHFNRGGQMSEDHTRFYVGEMVLAVEKLHAVSLVIYS
ncbi:hypothetical protein HAZT_HAZT003699 [Hyalella azteca]|uniref:Protein kinase domain-containing protein n=1 Tax=Hyalella azteca TaxID=294128 RepID=A0A6A0GZA2_HYAAZ|nr:hypothetical protein HAZT_HAZT003699 [Hyalella azteca]